MHALRVSVNTFLMFLQNIFTYTTKPRAYASCKVRFAGGVGLVRQD